MVRLVSISGRHNGSARSIRASVFKAETLAVSKCEPKTEGRRNRCDQCNKEAYKWLIDHDLAGIAFIVWLCVDCLAILEARRK